MAFPVITSRLLSLLHQARPRGRDLRRVGGEPCEDRFERTYWETLREMLALTRPQPARRRRDAA